MVMKQLKYNKLLISIVMSLILGACASKNRMDFIEKSNISRVIYTHQRKNETIVVKEEKTPNEHLIRVSISRNGEVSEAVHEINEHNFVFEVPLKEISVGVIAKSIASYEEYIQQKFHEGLAEHISEKRFTITARIEWDTNKLEALNSIEDIKASSAEVDIRLGSAISKLETSVLIDQGLPARYDDFVGQLILSQYFFRPKRGDQFEIKRAVFPAPNFLGNDFQARLLVYENDLQKRFHAAIVEHIEKDSLDVSARIIWDQQKLEDLKFQYQKDSQHSESEQDVQFITAVNKIQVSLLLDQNLSKENETFVKSLIAAQGDFQSQRGDSIKVQRIIFPAKGSLVATYEQKLEQKLQELLENYIHSRNFFVKIRLLSANDSNQVGAPPVHVGVVLNDLLDPKLDEFVKQVIPFTLNIDTKKGDVIEVKRERFPDSQGNSGSFQSNGSTLLTTGSVITKQQIANVFEQIKIHYEQMNYVKAMELTNQALLTVSERSQKVQLLKMKGSLHYLMQDPQNAKKAWNEVLRIEPNDEEAKQSLDMIRS